jgi:hypothetical protein
MMAKPRIECDVTFLSASEGGRSSPLPPGALSGDTYRPHLVIGNPNQRHAIVENGNRLVEEYIGVAFHDGPAVPAVGTAMVVALTLMYFPHPKYEQLQPGVAFTVREGSRIVAFGIVHRWLK